MGGELLSHGSARHFAAVTLLIAVVAASIAGLAPLAFTLMIVFLFAGPHQWVELRYFVSRLPSRFRPVRKFFLASSAGFFLLVASYIALACLRYQGCLGKDSIYVAYACWHCAFMLWVVLLAYFRSRDNKRVRWLWLLPLAIGFCYLSWIGPWFSGLVLVYFHPLLGLWILDRELLRTRRSWSGAYRKCLLLLPILLAVLYWRLSGAASLSTEDDLAWQATRIAGAGILKNVSSHLLVSLHGFLEMLHYGAWVIAIPLATRGWQKWRLERLAVVRDRPGLRSAVGFAFAVSTVGVCGLWLSFACNYAATVDVYFVLAIAHALAEFPFLLWML